MNEVIWKTLIYQGEKFERFEVSNNGKIRNSITKKEYKLHLNKNGYWQVCVSLGSRKIKKVIRIHKAVAETFILNPENKELVNHIDGNKQNNIVANLEWATYSENTQHAFNTGLMCQPRGVDSPCSKLTYDDIIYIRTHYIPNDYTYGTRALGRRFNVDHETIRDILNNNTYTNIANTADELGEAQNRLEIGLTG